MWLRREQELLSPNNPPSVSPAPCPAVKKANGCKACILASKLCNFLSSRLVSLLEMIDGHGRKIRGQLRIEQASEKSRSILQQPSLQLGEAGGQRVSGCCLYQWALFFCCWETGRLVWGLLVLRLSLCVVALFLPSSALLD